jgi:hypothetical protein
MCLYLYIYTLQGEECQDKKTKTGQAEQDRKNRTGRKRQAEQDCHDRLTGQDS